MKVFAIVNSKCSKVLNNFLFLFSTKMLVIRAGFHKILVRIANREDSYQSDQGLHYLSRPFGRELQFKILEHLPYTRISLTHY